MKVQMPILRNYMSPSSTYSTYVSVLCKISTPQNKRNGKFRWATRYLRNMKLQYYCFDNYIYRRNALLGKQLATITNKHENDVIVVPTLFLIFNALSDLHHNSPEVF